MCLAQLTSEEVGQCVVQVCKQVWQVKSVSLLRSVLIVSNMVVAMETRQGQQVYENKIQNSDGTENTKVLYKEQVM